MLKFPKASLFIILAIAAAIIAYQLLLPKQTSYAYHQVKKVAQPLPNYLLDINQHISQSIRPRESYVFPIKLGGQGPSDSLYSGPKQYPFYCMTLNSDLGQPLVDNNEGVGVPVYLDIKKKTNIIGYSKDCNITTRLSYFTVDSKNIIKQLTDDKINLFSTNNVTIFRVEQGSINRFIYTLVMPINKNEIGTRLAKSQWNNRLIYQFNGGSGIGYRQGRQLAKRIIKRQLDQLLDGYAVISSSGNRTSYTYNMLLAEDTARRVKKQFVSLYGEPLYTVGIGGSGGGLAQYIIGQNSTGILDG